MPIDTASSLVDALAQNKLLEPAQLEEAKSLRPRYTDPRALAKELIQRGWLTPFQVNQILANRAGDLLLGNYVILERIGEGGMGQVFKARNWKMGRIVAVKVIRKERLSNPQALKRFRREIEAASQLGHPNVVSAYDADTIGDTQLFAMEYVEGIDLAKLVKEKGPLPVARACDYIRQAALGLQHASEKGLVHRDIKPNNLLVTKDAKGNHVVKLLDMGLARIIETEDTTLTKEGSVMGTPDYIAPEQARDAHKADIRADLYSLGCTFFFLLTGQVPFQGGSLTEKLLKHYIEPPPPVQKLRPEVPPGVAAIVHKLMEKKPSDRFQLPIELAEAIGEMVGTDGKFTARAAKGGMVIPTGLKKKAKVRAQTEGGGPPRRFALVAVGVFFTLVAAVVGMSLLGGSGSSDPTPSVTEVAKGKNTTPLPTTRVTTETKTVPTTKVVKKKDPDSKEVVQSPLEALSADAIWAADRVAWLPKEAVAVMGEHRGRHYGGPIPNLAYSPDGSSVASAGPDGVRVWNAGDTQQRTHLKVVHAYGAAFSHDGAVLAASDLAGSVHIYATQQLGAEPVVIKAEGPVIGPAYGLAFSPRSRLLAVAHSAAPVEGRPANTESAITFWDLSGERPQKGATVRGHRGPIYVLAFDASGNLLASAGQDQVVRLWEPSGESRGSLTGHSRAIRGLAFTPGGVLVSGSDDGTMRFWDSASGKPHPAMASVSPGSMVFSVAITREGPYLVAGLYDGRVIVYHWAPKQGARQVASLTDVTSVTAVAVDPKRRNLASATVYGTVRVWDWGRENEITDRGLLKGHLASVLSVDFSPDGGTLVSGSLDGSVKLWEMTGPAPQERDLRASLGGMSTAVISPDSRRLAALGQLAQLRLWDLPGASVSRDLQSGGKNRFTFPGGVAFSPDGRLLAATDVEQRPIRLWEIADGQPRKLATLTGHEGQVSSLAFAPQGDTLASASSADGTVRVWNAQTHQVLRQYTLTKNQPLTSLSFSPSGQLAFGTATDGIVKLVDPRNDRAPRDLKAHDGIAWSVAFAPVGDVLATSGEDGKLILWETRTSRKLREWPLGGAAYALRFSPDARYLAVGNANGSIYILKIDK